MDDRMYCAVFPDDDDRRRSLDLLWEAIIGYTMTFGRVYATPQKEGISCWLPPGRTDVTLLRLIRTGFRLQRAVMRFHPESRKLLMALVSLIETMHRESTGEPHWYLWALGVSPESRNRGIGGALLDPVLTDADMTGDPCYLETQTRENVAFYEKRGFRVILEEESDIPGLTLWSMVREPR